METAKEYFDKGVKCYLDEKNDKAAIEYFSKAIDIDISNAEVIYRYRAECYMNLKEHDNALADYTKMIELNPTNPSSYRVRANCYRCMKEYDKAINDLTKKIELSPQASDFRDRAKCYVKLGKYDNAMLDLAIYLDKYADEDNFGCLPDDEYRTVCEMYLNMNKFDEAAILQLTNIGGGFIDYIKLKEYDKAIAYSNKVYGEECTSIDLALCYKKLGKNKEANKIYKAIIERHKNAMQYGDPRIGYHYCEIADCYRAIGDYNKAIDYLTKLIKKYQETEEDGYVDPDFYFNRAEYYKETGEYDKAKKDYIEVINICKQDADSGENGYLAGSSCTKLAKCYKELGDKEKSDHYYQKAVENFTKQIEGRYDNEYHEYRADCYKEIGNYQKAIEDYTTAIDNGRTYYYGNYKGRADCYQRFGKYELAIDDYKRALMLETECSENIIKIHDSLNELEKITSQEIRLFKDTQAIIDLLEEQLDKENSDEDDESFNYYFSNDYEDDDYEIEDAEEYEEDNDDDFSYENEYTEEYSNEESEDKIIDHIKNVITYLFELNDIRNGMIELYNAYKLDKDYTAYLLQETKVNDIISLQETLDFFEEAEIIGKKLGFSDEQMSQTIMEIINKEHENHINLSQLHYNPAQGRKLDL